MTKQEILSGYFFNNIFMPNKMNTAIYNRLKNGDTIVAELVSTQAYHRRWLAVYQPKHGSIRNDVPPHVYSVLDFELAKNKMEEYFSGEDMINEKRYYINTEEELFRLLELLKIDLEKFTYPWKCDYPL